MCEYESKDVHSRNGRIRSSVEIDVIPVSEGILSSKLLLLLNHFYISTVDYCSDSDVEFCERNCRKNLNLMV